MSALFRYPGGFHEEEEEGKREEHKAFLPRENKWLRGLWKVNAGMIEFANRHGGEQVATLDILPRTPPHSTRSPENRAKRR